MESKETELVLKEYRFLDPASRQFLAKTTAKNSLLRLADQIFIAVVQLRNRAQQPLDDQTKSRLLEELEHFNQQAEEAGYDREQVLIADYALKAYLDYRLNLHGKNKLFGLRQNVVTHEKSGNDYFFVLLQKISKNPDHFIDVIELMYMILNLGFKGKNHSNVADIQRLELVTQQTYRLIRATRGEYSRQFISSDNSITETHSLPHSRFWFMSAVILLSLLSLGAIYLGFNSLLNVFSTPLNQQFQYIEQGS